ncbi:MAG: hypothetical protein AAFX04_01050 [Pseudomonadota bacterium]
MKHMIHGAAMVSLLAAVPAQAQYPVYIDAIAAVLANSGPNTCITGTAPPEKEIDEARLPAPQVMQRYFDAALNGGRKSAAFRDSRKTEWIAAGVTVLSADIDGASDPIAITGHRLEPQPLRFFRAGDYRTALGQWAVVNDAGDIVGVYDGLFQRQQGKWKLQKLTVYGADDVVAPAMQYCAEPGDVTAHRLSVSQQQLEAQKKRVAKAEASLAKAEIKLAASEVKLEERPQSTRRKTAVETAQQRLESRQDKLEKRREELTDLREFHTKAQRDVDEIAAITVAPAETRQFTSFETTTQKELAEEKAAAGDR